MRASLYATIAFLALTLGAVLIGLLLPRLDYPTEPTRESLRPALSGVALRMPYGGLCYRFGGEAGARFCMRSS